MKTLNGPLSYGALHSVIFIPGVGNLGPTLDASPLAQLNRVTKMTLEGDMVVAEAPSKAAASKGKAIRFYIPKEQFTHMVPVAPEEMLKNES